MALADWKYKLPFVTHPQDKLIAGLDGILGDGDAIALLPYDDGTFFLKRAYWDKELVGGMGGFETDDGDKIVVDGSGEAVRELFGVPMVLGVDPSEHAAAVDPIKALVAHKNDIGEWIRVDKDGNVVDIGPAVEPAPESDAPEAVPDGGAQVEDIARMDLENVVTEAMQDTAAKGGSPTYGDVMAELAESGEVRKVYDIAPPSAPVYEDGEWQIDEATHIAVDQSKAANLIPRPLNTVELNTALDKARMEEHEEGKLMKYMVYGVLIGALTVGVPLILFVVLLASGTI